jgi:tetratricopeptide (TPR) repeat protein
LTQDAATDRGLQAELGAAYIRIGDIQGNPNKENLGDLPGALASYAKAEQIARKLVAAKRSDDALALLANALRSLTEGNLAHNDQVGARRVNQEAVEIVRERVRYSPQSEPAQSQLAAVLFDRWRVSRIGDLSEATSVYEGLLARNPEDSERQRNVALMHKYSASHLLFTHRYEAAWEHLKRAEDLDQQRVQHAPHDPTAKIDLAIDLSQWSEFFQHTNVGKAIEYAERSAAIRRDLAAADRSNMRNQDRLAYILRRLGDLRLNSSPREALANYIEAKTTAERLQTEALRLPHLGTSLAGMGAAYRKLGEVRASCVAYEQSLILLRTVVASNDEYASRMTEAENAHALCSRVVSPDR